MAIQFPPINPGDPEPVNGETYLYLPTNEEYVCKRASMAQTPQWTPKGTINESTFAYQGLANLRGPAPAAETGWIYSSNADVPADEINDTWLGLADVVAVQEYQLVIFANPTWALVNANAFESPWFRTADAQIQPRIDGDDINMVTGSYLIDTLPHLPGNTPVPVLRNVVNKSSIITTVNEATDTFGQRLAGLFPAVIDRMNTYLRYNDGIWNAAKAAGNAELGSDWAGLYIENFEEDNTIDGSMEVEYIAYSLNASKTGFGNSDIWLGLVIKNFRYKSTSSLTNLTDDQLSGIILHELMHPTFSTTMSENNTQTNGAYTNKATFPTAYNSYINALNLTDAEADGKIMTRQFECGSTDADPDDGTSYVHWDNVTRDVDGQTYKGIVNDCLRTCYETDTSSPNSPSNWILTDLSINAAVDVGMERVKEGSEGTIQVKGDDIVFGTPVTYSLPSYGIKGTII